MGESYHPMQGIPLTQCLGSPLGREAESCRKEMMGCTFLGWVSQVDANPAFWPKPINWVVWGPEKLRHEVVPGFSHGVLQPIQYVHLSYCHLARAYSSPGAWFKSTPSKNLFPWLSQGMLMFPSKRFLLFSGGPSVQFSFSRILATLVRYTFFEGNGLIYAFIHFWQDT